MRRRATLSERILWQVLRDRRLGGHKFRRQHPVGQFVVDFCCLEAMLAVEIGGSAHDGRQESDAERQQILESLGLRFLRLAAEDVERDLAQVLTRIEAALQTGVRPSPAHGAEVAPDLLPSPAHGRGAGGEGQCP